MSARTPQAPLGPEHPGDLLSAYLDEELTEPTAARVDAHVADCSRCRSELDELDGARSALRGLPLVPAPTGLTQGLVRSRQLASRRGLALALVAASVAVVAGLLVAPTAPGDGGSGTPALSLTSDGPRFDAGLTSTPSATPGDGQAVVRPGTVEARRAREAVAAIEAEDESLGGRVGDAVAGLLDAIGG